MPDDLPTCGEFRLAANMCVTNQRLLAPGLSWQEALMFDKYAPNAPAEIPLNPWLTTPAAFSDWEEYYDHLICAPWKYAAIQVHPVLWPYGEEDQADWNAGGVNTVCEAADYTSLSDVASLDDLSNETPPAAASQSYAAYCGTSSLPPLATAVPSPAVSSSFSVSWSPNAPWCDCYLFDEDPALSDWGGLYVDPPYPRDSSGAALIEGKAVKGGLRWHRTPSGATLASGDDVWKWIENVVERYDGDGVDDAFDEVGSICHEATGGPVQYTPSLACPVSARTITNTDCVGRAAPGTPIPPVLHYELANEPEANGDFRWDPAWSASMAEDYESLVAQAEATVTSACSECGVVNGGAITPPSDSACISSSAATGTFNPTGAIPGGGIQSTLWTDFYSGRTDPVSACTYAPSVASSMDLFAFHHIASNTPTPSSAYGNALGYGAPPVDSWGDPNLAAGTPGLGWLEWMFAVEDAAGTAFPDQQHHLANEIWVPSDGAFQVGSDLYEYDDQANHVAQGLAVYLSRILTSPFPESIPTVGEPPGLFAYGALFDTGSFAGLHQVPGPGSLPNPAASVYEFFGELLDDAISVQIRAPQILSGYGECAPQPSSAGDLLEIWSVDRDWLDGTTPTVDYDPTNIFAAEYLFDTASGRQVLVYWNEADLKRDGNGDVVLPPEWKCDTSAPSVAGLNSWSSYTGWGSPITPAVAGQPEDPNTVAGVVVACHETAGSSPCP